MDFKEYINDEPKERLDYFMETLSTTNRTPEYYVNWEKVNRNTEKYELELTTMGYLIGKDNIIEEARELFKKQPELLKTVPILIAARDRKLDVLLLDDNDNMEFYDIDFKNIDIGNLEVYIEFMENSGLFDFLQNGVHKSLVDFVYGVETGLDSNGRKNRSGKVMEDILERNVAKMCERLNYKYKDQASAKWMHDTWGVHVPVDKSERRFDMAIYDDERDKVYVIETNYYGGGGSKLKSVSGEFRSLNNLINSSEHDVTFAWVTDGQGWHTAKIPLSEAFQDIKNIFNLSMLRKDYIYDLIK
ncbi:type II restriction endonuclease [Staphylococcus debuckii]|uniref:type II restriction endonuclease n=1 Tax=Staphylococcus debuckii TaxID=2044912 RepID=UPI000F430ACE|nr:type II restriction endonuclease [Staphylococcus debuckii]AYU54303.1 restriction endonuclease [Staphylococcus debuckii]